MGIPTKGPADYWYEPGGHNAVCYECGRKMKASMLVKHWQGYWVCPEHWEPRHPQDFVKSVPDNMTVPWDQPDPAWVFAATCGPNDITGISDWAVSDCAISDYVSPFFDPQVFPDDVAPQ